LDKKIYALRDVTGTVASIPLIASSIMSKKIAVESNGIVLDIKVGSGAFMKCQKKASELADLMIKIGKKFDKKIIAVLSSMEQPLGESIGNALEVQEAIEVLKGRGSKDLNQLVKKLASLSLLISGKFSTEQEAALEVDKVIKNGTALESFKNFVRHYNGNAEIIENYNLLNISKNIYEIKSESDGYICEIDSEKVGNAAMKLGAGRKKKDDAIDYGVGLKIIKKISDKVKRGDTICKVYYKEIATLKEVEKDIKKAYKISQNKVKEKNIILEIK